jgi:pimeloyl-ACP methyl ester carboxylesterase
VIRRTFIASSAAATIGAISTANAATAATARNPIVLVHGAWHGGWCWQRVAPLLRAAGHVVYTPTLTGLGERAHLARPDINLDLHAQDLQAMLEMEDLTNVTLVGHSYAGFVISMLAERIRPRLRQLVYLDAFVPDDGKSLLDYIQPPERQAAFLKSGRETGYAAALPLTALGVVKAEDLAWAQPRITPHPFASLEQPIRLAQPAGNGLPRTFISCTSPASGSFGQFAAKVRNQAGWQFHELATGHDAMITNPPLLADLLLRVAQGVSP